MTQLPVHPVSVPAPTPRLIDEVKIAAPCPADWDQMTGNDDVRFCGSCEKNVYNLSRLTERELAALIVHTEGKFCGRIYFRADGTAITADCPVGLAAKAKRAARWAFAASSVMVLSILSAVLAAFWPKTACHVENIKKQLPVLIDEDFDHAVAGGVRPMPPPMMGEPMPIDPEPAEVKRPVKMGKIAAPAR